MNKMHSKILISTFVTVSFQFKSFAQAQRRQQEAAITTFTVLLVYSTAIILKT